jgi:hypothetical protein
LNFCLTTRGVYKGKVQILASVKSKLRLWWNGFPPGLQGSRAPAGDAVGLLGTEDRGSAPDSESHVDLPPSTLALQKLNRGGASPTVSVSHDLQLDRPIHSLSGRP